MRQEIVDKILRDLERGYDQVARPKFSDTRKHFWRELEWIGRYVQPKDRVLDFGCGNGRLADFLAEKYEAYVGVDVSCELIRIAQEKHGKTPKTAFMRINRSGRIPFPDGFFNTVFSIAVFHHFPSRKLRLEAAKELFRVTAPGGWAVVTVWNVWQKKYRPRIWENAKKIFLGSSQTELGDLFIPFKINDSNEELFLRYHHAFTRWELTMMMKKAGFRVERCELVEGKNLVCIGQR